MKQEDGIMSATRKMLEGQRVALVRKQKEIEEEIAMLDKALGFKRARKPWSAEARKAASERSKKAYADRKAAQIVPGPTPSLS
jgi:hypothetical protein